MEQILVNTMISLLYNKFLSDKTKSTVMYIIDITFQLQEVNVSDLKDSFEKALQYGQCYNVFILNRDFYPSWMNFDINTIKTGSVINAYRTFLHPESFINEKNEVVQCVSIRKLNLNPSSYADPDNTVYSNLNTPESLVIRGIRQKFIENVKNCFDYNFKVNRRNKLQPPSDDFYHQLIFSEVQMYDIKIRQLIKAGFMKKPSENQYTDIFTQLNF